MNILHLCLGLYNFWTTYEGEYINESIMRRKDCFLKIWGRNRPGYKKGLKYQDIVSRLYGANNYPDVVIVHSSMQKHDDKYDKIIFEGLETARENSMVIWRTFDAFGNKRKFYVDQIKRYKPQIVLSWYKRHVEEIQHRIKNVSTVKWFPHSVGRRYFNKNENRKFDIGLIGRCELKDNRLEKKHFPKIKVFIPPKRNSRPEKGNNLVNDLNLCRFSWNSPANGETGLRFIEAPACGTISMVPAHFRNLDDLFSRECYVVCDNNLKKAQKIMSNMSSDEFICIQQRAYKEVMNRHTMDLRIEYLMDLINGKNRDPKDYYAL